MPIILFGVACFKYLGFGSAVDPVSNHPDRSPFFLRAIATYCAPCLRMGRPYSTAQAQNSLTLPITLDMLGFLSNGLNSPEPTSLHTR